MVFSYLFPMRRKTISCESLSTWQHRVHYNIPLRHDLYQAKRISESDRTAIFSITINDSQFQFPDSEIIDRLLISCEHPPSGVIHTIFIGILFNTLGESRNGSMLNRRRWANGVSMIFRGSVDFIISCKRFMLFVIARTNTRATGKEKINHQNFIIGYYPAKQFDLIDW